MNKSAPHSLTLSVKAYGVPIHVDASDTGLMEAVREVLPPGHTPSDPGATGANFLVTRSGAGLVDVLRDGAKVADGVDLDRAIGILDAEIRGFVAVNADDWVFVHAGVVAYRGKALVLPGLTFAGKTTLVAALVRAGATYYSDEFAVLDDAGLVHPYAKPLSIRFADTTRSRETTPEELGGCTGQHPAAIGLVAITRYRAGATWSPERATAARGALAMLTHTGPARDRPRQSLDALRKAVTDALILIGERGEAEPTAHALLEAMSE